MIFADTKAEFDGSKAHADDACSALNNVSPGRDDAAIYVAAAQAHATLSVAAALRALVLIVDEKAWMRDS